MSILPKCFPGTQAAGVRLHPSVNMLLEVGRERARQRAEAMQGSEDE